MSEPGSSCPMCLSAELTIVPSRKTAPDPMTVAMSVQRCRVVIGATAGAELGAGAVISGQCRIDSPPCPDPWRSSAPESSYPRCSRSTPACWRRAGAPGRAWRSSRRRPTRTARPCSPRWAAMGVAHFGALGAEVEPVLVRDRRGRRRSRRGPGDRRGGPHLPVGRQAGVPDGGPRWQRRRPGAGGCARAWRGPGRVLGRGDGPRRLHVRSPAASRALAAPLAARARLRSGRVGRAPLRRLAGADVRA